MKPKYSSMSCTTRMADTHKSLFIKLRGKEIKIDLFALKKD